VPRVAVKDNSRMSLRIRAEEKALLLRAVALDRTDLTDFVLSYALKAAKAVIQQAEHLQLTERDSLWVLEMLEIRLCRTRDCWPRRAPCPSAYECEGVA